MEQKILRIVVAALALSAIAQMTTAAQDSVNPTLSTAAVHEIHVVASKYKFDPAEIHVKKGENVRLIFTATDATHGIKLDEFKINQRLETNKPTTVEFTPDKIGTFVFKCSVFCGIGHRGMKGKLIVDE